MARYTAAVTILYAAVVYFLSFVLEALHIITKPPLREGFVCSALFYLGLFFFVLGSYFYANSTPAPAILCWVVGVTMSVLKASSDSLRAKAAARDGATASKQ